MNWGRSTYQKCDAPRCGSHAEVATRLGARYCRGHAYLAEAKDDATRQDELKPKACVGPRNP